MKCIKDRTGRFLSENEFTLYVEREDIDIRKFQLKLNDEAKAVFTDYYDAVHTLCEAQTNLMASTKVLEEKLEEKAVFLDIIKQVQLPAVPVLVRTVEEIEAEFMYYILFEAITSLQKSRIGCAAEFR